MSFRQLTLIAKILTVYIYILIALLCMSVLFKQIYLSMLCYVGSIYFYFMWICTLLVIIDINRCQHGFCKVFHKVFTCN